MMICACSECKGFQDDWMLKNIDKTALESPVTYGTEIPIRCIGGFEKLSGPEAVTCIEGTTFFGLDDADDLSCPSEYMIFFGPTRFCKQAMEMVGVAMNILKISL